MGFLGGGGVGGPPTTVKRKRKVQNNPRRGGGSILLGRGYDSLNFSDTKSSEACFFTMGGSDTMS